MTVIIPFEAKEEERKTMMWVYYYFFLQCGFHFIGNLLLFKRDPPVYFELSNIKKRLLGSSYIVCTFSKCLVNSFYILQDSAKDYDSQDKRKLLAVSSNYTCSIKRF